MRGHFIQLRAGAATKCVLQEWRGFLIGPPAVNLSLCMNDSLATRIKRMRCGCMGFREHRRSVRVIGLEYCPLLIEERLLWCDSNCCVVYGATFGGFREGLCHRTSPRYFL